MLSGRLYRVLLAAAALVILVLSLIPRTPRVFSHIRSFDKIVHFISYSTLSYLTFFSLKGSRRWRTFASSAVACFLFGGLVELLQYLTPRYPEVLDLVANIAGSVSGALIAAVFSRWRAKVSS